MDGYPRRYVRRLVATALIPILVSACAASAAYESTHRAVPTPTPSPTAVAAAAIDSPDAPVVPGVTIAANAILPATFPDPAVAGPARRYHVPVLMYHRIAPASERGRDMPDLVLDPRVFDAQLTALEAQGWRTITSAQLAAAVRADLQLPARTFVITLDDGRDDGYTHAFPILLQHGFVATFFVITGRVNERHYLTWPELSDMQAAGMEIGNHTVDHLDEARYTRPQTDRQVTGAQAAIERNLGMPAVSFAYPYGRMPANLIASVKASGLQVAYTTVGGADETAATAYLWPRLRIHATTTAAGILWLMRPYRQISPTKMERIVGGHSL
jgi:peptidoglycan/xylan/chitin deacetylase (PgdA/CDA1 family)